MNQHMKVAVVCDVLGEENNGTTVAAMNLIRFLKERGHEVRVVCPDEERRGQPGFYVVPQLNVGPLNDYVKRNGVSIAISDDTVLNEALRDVDIIHIMTPFFLGKAAVDFGKTHGIPVTAGFHAQAENITNHLHLMNSHLVNDLTYKALYRLAYQYVDAIHYPTQFIRDVFESEVGKTNGYVISNGVNSRFVKTPAERPKAWEGKFVILFTGRYGKEKSHKVLMDAVMRSRYADKIQLVFAGEGPLHDEIKGYGDKLPNPPVMRFFSRDEMLNVINSADLYAHPAEIEIEAIACLEAISCGLVPVIADSPRSATRFFALGEHNLFRFNDPESLKDQIEYWMEHPAEKEECSRQYQGYTRRFEQRHCMEQMEQMLLETIDPEQKEKNRISGLLAAYQEAIHTQDETAFRSLWKQSGDVTLISIANIYSGLDAICRDFLLSGIRSAYDSISLIADEEPAIRLLNESTAIVVFKYHTECVGRENGELCGIRGVETQVVQKVDNAWKLVHVHYSK